MLKHQLVLLIGARHGKDAPVRTLVRSPGAQIAREELVLQSGTAQPVQNEESTLVLQGSIEQTGGKTFSEGKAKILHTQL